MRTDSTQELVESSQPAPSSRKTSRRWFWLSLVILVLVITGAVTTTMLLATNPSQAVNTVVQDYYNAVERQKYATAYTYINHQMLTSSGQLQTLSLAAYTNSSLSLDQAAGTLTAYTISTTSITNGIATVIVDRTRGGKVAEVFVELVHVGNNWKISAIVPGWPIPSN